MAKKLDKDISGSVQEKRGMLYLVVSYKDPITQKHKTKWVGMGVPVSIMFPELSTKSTDKFPKKLLLVNSILLIFIRPLLFLSKKAPKNSGLWRRGRDSNPCGLAPKRFSSFDACLLSLIPHYCTVV